MTLFSQTVLALRFADGDIDRAGYELGRAQAQIDLEAAEAEPGRLRPSEPAMALPILDEVLRLVTGWRDVLTGGDILLQRDVLGALVERVQFECIGYGRFRITLVWSDVGERLCRAAGAALSDTQAA